MRQKYSIGPVWFLMFACAFFTSCVTQGKKVQQEELSQYVEPRIGLGVSVSLEYASLKSAYTLSGIISRIFRS